MGKITGSNPNTFKSVEYLYAKIKRQWASFDSVNMLDDSDFPTYTAEVLKKLGIGALKESAEVLHVKNSKAPLPKDFRQIHAAYKCSGCESNIHNKRHLQNISYFENDITCETIRHNPNKCEIECVCPDKVVQAITIRQYVNETCDTYKYNHVGLLKLSPNAISLAADGCLNVRQTCQDEITINNNTIITNFSDGDIYLEYYALAVDENNIPLIPDVEAVETAVEWYIKWQVMLNYWLVDDLANAQNKWQKAEQLYKEALASARYYNKLPSFATCVNYLRMVKGINKIATFSK